MDAQHVGEIIAAELTTLIGVEDLRPALVQSVLQRFDGLGCWRHSVVLSSSRRAESLVEESVLSVLNAFTEYQH